nr:hypothetical protein [Tanacetum cinerariifolium]GEY86867.1 hypothetical protein [Tanacetum cinerariifolium]
MASTSGIFTIELYAFPNKTWVYDTGYSTHISNTLQGLRGSKKLKHGALSLYMGNGMRVAIEVIGSFDLILPSGLIIILDNCHFAPTVTKGVVSIPHLVKNCYIHTFMNYGYALESVARILNMVPTKKVERMSYEIWHGKAPKLSYLRSIRITQAPNRYGFYVDDEEHELGDLNEPPNYKATLSDPEYKKWLEAMTTEMQSMKDNQAWILVELPSNGQTVGSKWLLKKKTDMDGNVHTFKAHIRAIRILLAIAAFYNYRIWQMDVKTAFLNGHLGEDVYMVQPEGFVDLIDPNKVYLGEAAYILGIKIMRDRSKRLISLSQSAYLEKNLKIVRMKNSKKGYTLMMEKPNYRKSQGARKPKAEYIAVAEASMEAVWIRKFINGLGDVVPSNKRPIKMLCDNEPIMAIANDPDDNIVDPFTKPMLFNKHYERDMAIGIVPTSSIM